MKNILISILFAFSVFADEKNFLSVMLGTQSILSEEDVNCLTLRSSSVTFELNKSGREKFLKTTSENIGKEMKISICSMGEISPVIRQKIDSSTFSSAITDKQFKCLQDFAINKCK